ncbi:ATP-binding cassette domain-containing protein [Devosia sp. D6-9]|nr:ATP-binding cassette domain-containing protein [Devosia sp. D6-9]
MPAATSRRILEVRNLRKYYPVRGGLFLRKVADVKAVDDVSLYVDAGETLGLVGESGCGKSTTGRAIMRLTNPTAGQVLFRLGEGDRDDFVDFAGLDRHHLHAARRQMQMVFQDPNSSLNPKMTVQDILAEPFQIHPSILPRRQVNERVAQLMHDVGIRPEYRNRYPHQFSGGQRQRLGIARALALNPKLIIADEPVSALDVSIQGQVLNLLVDLQKRLGLTYIMVAHDLSVVEQMCDRVAVMYLGKIVEIGETKKLYFTPRHPYTEALLSAVPVADPSYTGKRIVLEGNIPSPLNPPNGCRFHTRCRYAKEGNRMERCSREEPALRSMPEGQMAACHFAEELKLTGVRREERASVEV